MILVVEEFPWFDCHEKRLPVFGLLRTVRSTDENIIYYISQVIINLMQNLIMSLQRFNKMLDFRIYPVVAQPNLFIEEFIICLLD